MREYFLLKLLELLIHTHLWLYLALYLRCYSGSPQRNTTFEFTEVLFSKKSVHTLYGYIEMNGEKTMNEEIILEG